WFLVLDDEDDGSNIEVTARPEGTYDVTADDGHREGHPDRPFTADQAKAVLLKYRARDPAWRDTFTWESEAEEEEEPRPTAKRSSEPPTWAVAIVVGSIALVVITALALQGSNNSLRAALPFGDSDYFFAGLIFLPLVVLFVVAVAARRLEVRRAAGWGFRLFLRRPDLPADGRAVRGGGGGQDAGSEAGRRMVDGRRPDREVQHRGRASSLRGRGHDGEDDAGRGVRVHRRWPEDTRQSHQHRRGFRRRQHGGDLATLHRRGGRDRLL